MEMRRLSPSLFHWAFDIVILVYIIEAFFT
jgi:hypothetical protein